MAAPGRYERPFGIVCHMHHGVDDDTAVICKGKEGTWGTGCAGGEVLYITRGGNDRW